MSDSNHPANTNTGKLRIDVRSFDGDAKVLGSGKVLTFDNSVQLVLSDLDRFGEPIILEFIFKQIEGARPEVVTHTASAKRLTTELINYLNPFGNGLPKPSKLMSYEDGYIYMIFRAASLQPEPKDGSLEFTYTLYLLDREASERFEASDRLNLRVSTVNNA